MSEPSSFDKLIGATLGSYRLEKMLEPGEWEAVFLARNDTTGTMYCLRILAVPADLGSEARIVYLGRLQQLANQVAALEHPSILPLLDYGTFQGMPYLVSPQFSMNSLSLSLARSGPTDAVLVGRYLDSIAGALEYAHQHAVLHRNLTTDCIFLKQDGNLVVADFGLIRMLDVGEAAHASLPRGMNSASAPAPEQLLGKPVGPYTDVYALGAVLYRMLTGHRVFQGKSRSEIAQQHLNAPVPSVRTWRSDLPAGIDSAIAKAMAKEPAQRYQQPGAFANAYAQIVAPDDTRRIPFVIASNAPQTFALPKRVEPIAMRPLATERRDGQRRISRRRALTLLGAGGGAAAAIVAVAVFGSRYLVGSTSPTSSAAVSTSNSTGSSSTSSGTTAPGQTARVLARTSDVPVNSAKQFAIANSRNPGLLIHLSDKRFVAFDSTCTHAGCSVNYDPANKLLECPCHSAVFDPAKNAAVVQGPAPSPLTKINITVHSDGTITTG